MSDWAFRTWVLGSGIAATAFIAVVVGVGTDLLDASIPTLAGVVLGGVAGLVGMASGAVAATRVENRRHNRRWPR